MNLSSRVENGPVLDHCSKHLDAEQRCVQNVGSVKDQGYCLSSCSGVRQVSLQHFAYMRMARLVHVAKSPVSVGSIDQVFSIQLQNTFLLLEVSKLCSNLFLLLNRDIFLDPKHTNKKHQKVGDLR